MSSGEIEGAKRGPKEGEAGEGKRATIGVVIPTYNRAYILGRALDSLLTQTRPPDLIAVVDDGSTDETPQLLSSYLEKYPKQIAYLRQRENRGIHTARNRGMDYLAERVEWITFLDSDDIFLPDGLAVMEETLIKYPNYSLYGFGVVDREGRSYHRLNGEVAEIGYEDYFGQTEKGWGGEWVHLVSASKVRDRSFRFPEHLRYGGGGVTISQFLKKEPALYLSRPVRVYNRDNSDGVTRKRVVSDPEKMEDLLKSIEWELEVNGEFIKNSRKLRAYFAAIKGKPLFYLGRKKEALLETLKGLCWNPAEPRLYRNLLLFLGFKL